MNSTNRRLDRIARTLEPMQEAKLTVTLADGSTTITDASGVWDFFKDEELRKKVMDVEADQYGYCELANLVLALCRS